MKLLDKGGQDRPIRVTGREGEEDRGESRQQEGEEEGEGTYSKINKLKCNCS